MDARQTLDELRRLGVNVQYDRIRDRLRVEPVSLVSDTLADDLRRHKREMVRLAREERGAFTTEAEKRRGGNQAVYRNLAIGNVVERRSRVGKELKDKRRELEEVLGSEDR
ncbi:MAG: hypothetical protein H0V53_14755 [Rubrobacter sp.]|nr:hypothetical protein [Rubrobacter sp.]